MTRSGSSPMTLSVACRHTMIAIDLALAGEPLPDEDPESLGTQLSLSTGVYYIAELFETARATILYVKSGDPAHRSQRASTLVQDLEMVALLMNQGDALRELSPRMHFEEHFCLMNRAMWTIIEGGFLIRADVLCGVRNICERMATSLEDGEVRPHPSPVSYEPQRRISFRNFRHSVSFRAHA